MCEDLAARKFEERELGYLGALRLWVGELYHDMINASVMASIANLLLRKATVEELRLGLVPEGLLLFSNFRSCRFREYGLGFLGSEIAYRRSPCY